MPSTIAGDQVTNTRTRDRKRPICLPWRVTAARPAARRRGPPGRNTDQISPQIAMRAPMIMLIMKPIMRSLGLDGAMGAHTSSLEQTEEFDQSRHSAWLARLSGCAYLRGPAGNVVDCGALPGTF